ncbi:MAG: NAD(P)-binding domain-containing protein [Actinomycetota bacterium]|nr:NAD(P)-binding domain-containing protein [Actinomycetota bacterium]
MRVGLIGAGNMACAMARGWGDPVLCSDAGSGRALALAAELGGRAAVNAEVAAGSDIVFLCHKPYQLGAVAQEIRPHVRAVASVLAGGIELATLSAAYPDTPIFRLMPNTPVQIGRGIVLYTPAPGVDAELERELLTLLARLGTVVSASESELGVASSVTSVGPAYQALLVEAQIDAAVRHGLGPALAARLVVETMNGTGALLQARDYDTLAVRREVTSPGGSTARGLDALERAGVRNAFSLAMDRVSGEPKR